MNNLKQVLNYYKRDTCRLCLSRDVEKVLPLTPTALCDAYVQKDRLNETQEVYPLDLFQCRSCGFVFLPYIVDPEVIYRDYIYVTTSSLGLADHFRAYAGAVMHKIRPAKGTLVIDIGSNDGTLLKFFKEAGMRTLGVEPAVRIAKEATDAGVETLPEFFDLRLAEKIKKRYGPAAIITVNNLFANIDDLITLAEGVRLLLSPEGVFIIESSYLADMIENMVFDFIYHEHLSYLSVRPLIKFFRKFGMELIDVERVATKGGSLRYYFQQSAWARNVSPKVGELSAYEERIGLDRPDIFDKFGKRVELIKSELNNLLDEIRSKGCTIAGYGGSATTTTFLYHLGIGGKIGYILDDNPAKQDTFSPGYHIPVLNSRVMYYKKPDYILILAWRYADVIMKRHGDFLKQGGHFIIPLPEIRVV